VIGVVASGASVVRKLDLGEAVVELHSQGLIGVAVTNRRLLAIHPRAADFAELRFRVSEGPGSIGALHLRDRIAVAELPARLVAFSADLASWFELSLGPGEKPREVLSDENVAAIVTPRRAIAFSPRSNGFVEFTLLPTEDLERSTLADDSITLVLPHRILIFRAGDKLWTSLNR
jgi:hypothetical protein